MYSRLFGLFLNFLDRDTLSPHITHLTLLPDSQLAATKEKTKKEKKLATGGLVSTVIPFHLASSHFLGLWTGPAPSHGDVRGCPMPARRALSASPTVCHGCPVSMGAASCEVSVSLILLEDACE